MTETLRVWTIIMLGTVLPLPRLDVLSPQLRTSE